MNMRSAFFLLALAGSSWTSAQERGDWVLGQWKGGEYWFPGVVESRSGDEITIAYDDGTSETRPAKQVRKYDWDIDSRVECQWNGGTDWFPGRITAMSKDGITLNIEYDDGDKEQTRTGACRSR